MERVEMDITPVFRQVVLKLANTYEPQFDYEDNESFKNQIELFENFSQSICDDFAKQLYPLLVSAISKEFDKKIQPDN